MGDNLKQKMLGALAWSSIDRFGQQAVQLVIGLFLARLLSPNDYGLIGMIMIFVALSSVMVDGGFGQALIRKQNVDQRDYSTIFFLNLAISILVYLILFFTAPIISTFYNQPELTSISRVLFLSIIFYALYFVQYVIVVKELAYKNLAVVNITASFISGGLGIFLALKGIAVWALVIQQISFHIFRLILFFAIRKWRPSAFFSFSVIRESWKFSINLLSTSALNVIFNNFYLVLIGKFYPLKQVGYYTQANKLSETVNYSFQQVLQSASYPLLVQIQDEDERYRRVYRKMTRTISTFLFPVLFTLIIVSEPLISILLSSKWAASIPLFQLLCLANIFSPLFGLNTSVLNSRGESKKSLHLELIKKGFIFGSIIVCFRFGIVSMLIGFIIANFISYAVSMFFIRQNIAYRLTNQFVDVFRSIIVAIIVSIFVFLSKGIVSENSYIIQLLFQTVVAFTLYLILFVFLEKELFEVTKKIILSRIKKNN